MASNSVTTCVTCGQKIPQPIVELPTAHHLNALTYLGRQVYWIAGRRGLYGTGPRVDNYHADSIFCRIVDRPGRGHGTERKKTLFKLNGISDEIAKAYQQPEAGESDHAD